MPGNTAARISPHSLHWAYGTSAASSSRLIFQHPQQCLARSVPSAFVLWFAQVFSAILIGSLCGDFVVDLFAGVVHRLRSLVVLVGVKQKPVRPFPIRNRHRMCSADACRSRNTNWRRATGGTMYQPPARGRRIGTRRARACAGGLGSPAGLRLVRVALACAVPFQSIVRLQFP